MKRLIPCLLLTLAVVSASSQKIYFIYLQSEAQQPFFVKLNKKIQSSSASGYLILSRLHDSTYSFSVGFPQQKWPEQNFMVTIGTKDHGYLLKNFGEKGWGLFNLQSMEVQMASTTAKISSENTDPSKVSAFTDVLSKAADDPTLKEKPVEIKLEEKKKDTIAIEKKPVETPVVLVEKPVETKPVEKKPDTVDAEKISEVMLKDSADKAAVAAELYKPSVVTKKSESSTTEGFGLVFTDKYSNGNTDTIRILIPNPKEVVQIKSEPVVKEEKKFLDISSDTTQKTNNLPIEKKGVVIEEKTTVLVTKKSNCKDVAIESDFFKLRKQMAAAGTDDDMVSAAKKYFKTKCFSVAQIKNLSTLFLNDAGKYQFFDAAYPYISDGENFSSLQAELKEEYYITRFKAMLR